MWGNIAIAFLLAFIVSFVATPYTIKIANKIGAVDVPKDKRRMHTKAMPKFGGPAVILGVLVSMIYLIAVMSIEGSLDLFSTQQYGKKLLGVLLGVIVIAITGTLDDIKTLKPWQELLGQTIAAIIVVAFGTKIEHLDIPFLYKIGFNETFSIIVTIIWIVGVTNAINLIDGLDGLSGGISSIYYLTIGIIATMQGKHGLDFVLTFVMLGSTLGFLVHNFNPAKIFAGDSGSNFMGFIIAVIALLGFKNVTLTSFIIPILLLAIPILDTLFAILRRLINHKPLGEPDKNHLHHQLLRLKLSQKKTVIIIYIVDLLFASASIVYAVGNSMLGSNIYGMVIYAILFVFITNIKN